VAPEDLSIFAETTLKPKFPLTPNSLKTTRKRKETEGKRVEKKKRLLALIILILPTLEKYFVSERQKTTRCTPVQTPKPRSTVFKNPGKYNKVR